MKNAKTHMSQQEKWGLNHRMVAENIFIAATTKDVHKIDAIHEIMDALDYIWRQGKAAGELQANFPKAR